MSNFFEFKYFQVQKRNLYLSWNVSYVYRQDKKFSAEVVHKKVVEL